MIVTRYGVHWASGGIAFLYQSGKSVQHALPIPDLRSPFELKAPWFCCPHAIDLTSTAEGVIDDPLFRVMLPLPVSPAGPRAWMCEPNEVITHLQALQSPQDQVEFPIWWEETKMQRKRLLASNIGTLVFNITDTAHVARMERVMEMAQDSQRRILFVTHVRVPTPPGVERLQTRLTLNVAGLPLRQIGAGALRHHMLTKELPI